jgi:ATP-dependent DNA ligase
MTILDILNAVAADPSKLAKEAILRQNADNETLKLVFVKAYDSMTQYYIRKIPTYTHIATPYSLEWGIKRLDMLSSRAITGQAGSNWLAETLASMSPDDAEVIKRIIGKDLKLGCSISTANKVWPKLIFEYPIMKCEQNSDKLIKKIFEKGPAIAQIKIDGLRFNAHVNGKKVEYFSGSGKPMEIHGVLDNYFLELVNLMPKESQQPYVFDSELLVMDEEGKPLPREVGNGIASKAIKGTMALLEAQQLYAVVWDIIPLEAFRAGYCSMPYSQRFEIVNVLISKAKEFALQEQLNFDVHVCQTWMVKDSTAAQVLFEDLLAKGQEGIVVKDPEGPWEDKRATHQIKYKAEETADMRCTGTYKGEPGTKYENFIGGLELETEDGICKTKCGSGLSDEQRRMDPSEFVGNIVEIFYNCKIKDKTKGTDSLFLPIFRNLRLDKTKANTFKELK